MKDQKRRTEGPAMAAEGGAGGETGAEFETDLETVRRGDSEKRSLSKGPGVVRDCLDETGSRVYYAVQFCRWVKNAHACLEMARGADSPAARRLRELARANGRAAREYYAMMMTKEGVAV